MLLYTFLNKEINVSPFISRTVLMWDTLIFTLHGCIQLKEAPKAFHSQVAQDLIRLKFAGFLTSQKQGKFKLIGLNIYVFQHSEYKSAVE